MDDLTFTPNGDGTYSVTDCDQNASGSLDIPSTHNGLPVTSIGDWAFRYCTSLASITIPDSVTSIGENTFQSCSSLTSITIPSSVTSIKESTFYDCFGLTSVTIPNSVTSIGINVFNGCSGLTSITIPNSVSSIERGAFYNSGLTSITIPNSVTSIGNWAFRNCTNLASITFEGDAPTFGSDVFLNSYSVTIYYYDDASGFSTPTFQGRPSQMLIRGAQFQIIEGSFTRTEAIEDAASRGGRLAVLDTQEKIDSANSYLASQGTYPILHIGLFEQGEGNWSWINGEPLGASNWATSPRQPSDSTRNNNLGMYFSSPNSYGVNSPSWDDQAPHSTQAYLLEVALDSDSDETILLGVKDDFSASNGAEVLSINDFLVQSGFSGLADTTTVNAQIAASFDISAYAGNITGATVKILKKPLNDSGAEDNDRLIILVGDQDINSEYQIALGWDGGANSYFDWDWRIGRTPTPVEDGFLIEIDLAQFNSINATDISIIDQMNAATSLSFICGSDSSWDYLELTLQAGQTQVVVDSDGDGLSDGDEVNTHGTDPNDVDTDDDGLSDGYESLLSARDFRLRGSDIDGETVGDKSGYPVALSADGSILAIGARHNDGNGDGSGHVRLYQWDGSAWNQLGSDIDGEAAGDHCGSVALSADGSIVAIGAIWNDDNGYNSGHVRLFQWDGSSWNQLGNDIDGEAGGEGRGYGDNSGESVALSADGSIVAIGARYNDGNGMHSGHVRLYQWDGSAWNQLGSDIDGEAAGDGGEIQVALSADGSIIAIGLLLNDGNGNESGHVRLYQWGGSSWNQLGSDIDGEAAGDRSGISVSLNTDGLIVAIGAHANDGNGNTSGHVRLYQWDGLSWNQLGNDIDGEASGDESGFSVSLSSDGSIVAIGAPHNDGNGLSSGHVRLYQWDGSAWNKIGNDIDGEAADDRSGRFVSLSADGSIVAIGAYLNDGNGSESGHVRIYQLNTSITDPNDSDSDDDGLIDGDEVNTYGTDPNDSDSDDDGLIDGDEVNTYGTDSNDSDSDDDGLSDGDEINTYGTDPNNPDSDSDGLSDGVEVNTYGTDPNNPDSDGDGLSDGDEVSSGTDPTSIEPPASLAGKSYVLTALTGELSSVPDQVIFTADNFVYGFSGNSLHTVSYSYSDGTVIFSAEERGDFIYTSLNSGTYEKGEIGQDGTFYVESTGTFEEANISLSLQTNWQRTESFDNSLSDDYWQIDTTSGDSVAYNDGELNFIFAEGTADSANGYSNNREIEIDYAGALPLDEDWQIEIDDTYVSDSVDQFSMGYQLARQGYFFSEFGFVDYLSGGRGIYIYIDSGNYPVSDYYGSYYTPVISSADDAGIQNGLNFRIQHLASTQELIYSYQPDGASDWTEVARINLSTGAISGLGGNGNLAGQLPSSGENLFFAVDVDKYSTEAIPIENLEIGGIEIVSYAPPLTPADSDGDGLDDSVETNTGIYVSPNDTGTDPNNPDTDGDGVGDNADVFPNDANENVDTDGDKVGDNSDPFPNDPLELEKLGPSDFQPKENVGWIEVTYAYFYDQTVMPGIWHPIDENVATWFAFDNSWSYDNTYSWNPQSQVTTGPAGDTGQWSHYKTSNPNIYTCKFDWTNGTNGYGFTYDGRIDLDNDGNQDGIQIRSGIQFPAEGSQLDFNQILSALSDNLDLFALPANFTADDYDGDGTGNLLDIDDDNDGIADVYDSTALLYTVSNTSIPSSLSGYVEIFFSDYDSSSYGVWYGNGENSSINIWNDGVAESIFNDTYSWDSQNLISTASGEGGGGIFRVNLKDKTNDAFFVFTYVSEQNELYPDDSGKGFFYDGRIDLDNNGVADGVQIQSGAAFPDSDSTLDFRNIYNLAVTNFIPIEVLNYTSNDKYSSDAASRILGQTDVTSNPSDYGLFTSSDLSDAQSSSRTAGQQDVINSPSDYGLVGAEGVFDMRITQPGISTNGDKASMHFTIQSSDDLEEWNNEETIQRDYTMPSDKNFMRVSVGIELEVEPSLTTIATDTFGDKLVYDEFNNLYVNDKNTPLKRNGINIKTNTYSGWNFYAVEPIGDRYFCILKNGNQNVIMFFELDGSYWSNFYDITDLTVYENDFGQSLQF